MTALIKVSEHQSGKSKSGGNEETINNSLNVKVLASEYVPFDNNLPG
jgi:hypothetical protein